jgi:hypothetical protein
LEDSWVKDTEGADLAALSIYPRVNSRSMAREESRVWKGKKKQFKSITSLFSQFALDDGPPSASSIQ